MPSVWWSLAGRSEFSRGRWCLWTLMGRTTGHVLLAVVAVLLLPALATLSDEEVTEKIADIPCPLLCECWGPTNDLRGDCANRTLKEVPDGFSPLTVKLDLNDNNISSITNMTFRNLPELLELNLANNNLESLPVNAFREMLKLRSLHINDNQLSSVPIGSMTGLRGLQRLWLDGNLLTSVPTEVTTVLTELEALNLGQNKIESIAARTFQNLTKLVILMLHENAIFRIDPSGLDGLRSLKVLEVHDNYLTVVPEAIASLPSLRELIISDNNIIHLDNDAFIQTPKLTLLEVGGNPIATVGKYTFSNLPNLKKLTLSNVRQLEEFLDLSGTSALEHLRLDRGQLRSVPSDLCKNAPQLKSLNLHSNRLTSLPDLRQCRELRFLDLSYNMIRSIGGSPFQHQTKLMDLFLSNNLIERLPKDAFLGLGNLHVLDLFHNLIEEISREAFANLVELRDLNLGENRFPVLPTQGLQNLRQLKTHRNRNLKVFPPPEVFPKVHTLALSYAYHCCLFRPLARHSPFSASFRESIVWLTRDEVDMAAWSTNITDVWPGYENFSSKFEEFASQLWKAYGRDDIIPDNLAQRAAEYFEEYRPVQTTPDDDGDNRHPVQCLPEPGPFMPCEDLFGWWTLRCGVWVVFLLAMLGNGVVVVVLMFGRSKMDVPRFLVCNLAIADFLMGIYLGFLAVVDASTLGEFRVSGVYWQTSAGCQVAGFLGVLSSELSVYTLAVITLERNYAITHAMHLNKRLSLKHAAYIMGGGWGFALIMAILPLFGVSDYRKFAVCLPFETEDSVSLSYVVALIVINGVAFLILMGCYLKMYWVIRGSQAWNSNDSRIAKRMALLVFTDFLCWAPIAFFSMTAVFGLRLVSLEEAKVFTIFVLPLNSCANPFLYAIFTKQFKKDCVLICKRIEESRVTRGIGRYRHSSNFSNRHTPANTNSAVDRRSGEHPICQCTGNRGQEDEQQPMLYNHRPRWKTLAMRYLLCQDDRDKLGFGYDYTTAMAQVQKHEAAHKCSSSISSENFSSRSDSWRQGHIPLRLLERGRRNSWAYTHKSSQDSNSCSRQDSSTSTFRLSRSSVSSDTSNSTHGRSIRERAAAAGSQKGDNKPGNGDIVPTTYSRYMMGFGRNKPKLCRQTAVEDAIARGGSRGMDGGIKKSPPVPVMREGMCTSCGRRETVPSLRFKSKELEEKFNYFYNRLVETSNEDSSEATTSKDDQMLFSSEQSDQKTESGKGTVDTSLSEQQSEDLPDRPHIELDRVASERRTTHDGLGNVDEVRAKGPGPPDPHHLHISSEDIAKPKSRSLGNLGFDFKLFSRQRKAVSDNSLKKLSLRSLPAFLRSLSSQSTHTAGQKAYARSRSQVMSGPGPSIPACRSESVLRKPSSESVDWTMHDPPQRAPYIDDDEDYDDLFILSQSVPSRDDGKEAVCASQFTVPACETVTVPAVSPQQTHQQQQQPLRGTLSSTTEETSLIDHH